MGVKVNMRDGDHRNHVGVRVMDSGDRTNSSSDSTYKIVSIGSAFPVKAPGKKAKIQNSLTDEWLEQIGRGCERREWGRGKCGGCDNESKACTHPRRMFVMKGLRWYIPTWQACR